MKGGGRQGSCCASCARPARACVCGGGGVGVGVVVLCGVTGIVIRVFKTYDQHSGYNFPWCLGGTHSRYHDFHHTHNVGNYGRNELWDVVFGTADPWFRHLDKVGESQPAMGSKRSVYLHASRRACSRVTERA